MSATGYRRLTLCSDRGGFEAIPERSRRLDLGRVRDRLTAAGLPVVDARVLLVVTVPPEVTISPNGRMLFKTPSEGAAEAAFARLVDLLDLSPGSASSASSAR